MPYKDKEQERETKRRWYAANREKVLEYQRRRSAANREKVRDYYRHWRAANREKLREKQRHYEAANPKKARESQRRYKAANREKVREAERRWRAANPEKVREHRRRTARRLVAEFVAAYGGKCVCCEATENLSLDHIRPRQPPEDFYSSGRHRPSNTIKLRLKAAGWPKGQVQVLCCYCNRRKRNKEACPCGGAGNPRKSTAAEQLGIP